MGRGGSHLHTQSIPDGLILNSRGQGSLHPRGGMITLAITAWFQLFIMLIIIKENLPYELECVLMGILLTLCLVPPAKSALDSQEAKRQ